LQVSYSVNVVLQMLCCMWLVDLDCSNNDRITHRGTYADAPARGRQTLNQEELLNPSIVHFTGPLHPTLAVVLDSYVQPYTSKPWGYAGAPGNPYKEE